MSVASDAATDFGLRLFRHLVSSTPKEENILISGYGLSLGFSLLLLGTRGESESEIASLFKIRKESLTSYHQSASRFAASLTTRTAASAESLSSRTAASAESLSSESATSGLSSANRIFVLQNLSLVPSFLADAELYCDSVVEGVDFANAPFEAQVRTECARWRLDKAVYKSKSVAGC